MWLARDKDGSLYLFKLKPSKNPSNGTWEAQDFDFYEFPVDDWDSWIFPEIKWSDPEPTEIKLVKKK